MKSCKPKIKVNMHLSLLIFNDNLVVNFTNIINIINLWFLSIVRSVIRLDKEISIIGLHLIVHNLSVKFSYKRFQHCLNRVLWMPTPNTLGCQEPRNTN